MMKNYLCIEKLCIVFILIFLSACNDLANQKIETVDEPTESVEGEIIKGNGQTPPIKPDDYRVILSVDSIIKMNESGILQIWIGADGTKVSFPEGMIQDETTIPINIGKYAKITPIAPDFDVQSTTKTKCHKIHPSGSEVQFLLKPKTTGLYRVSATVELYEDMNCNGASIPKICKTLSVNVEVDKKKEASKKIKALWEIVWDKFLSFWGALITLVFAVLLFIIRRFLKKRTGFEEKED